MVIFYFSVLVQSWQPDGMVTLDEKPTICPTVYMWSGVGMWTFHRPRSLDLAQDFDATLTWGGVGMFTFLRPRSLDLVQDVDAMLTWCGDVHVPSTTFSRPCARRWCYAHMGWGEDVHVPSTTFSRPCARCWCYAHMGWGGDVHVPSTTFSGPCARCWCYAHMGWWCSRSFDRVPSTLCKMLMLCSHGVGMFTFLRPRSLDLAQDVDAMLTWGGDVHVPSTTFSRPCARCWCYAHMGWGGDVHVPSTTFSGPCARCWCYAHMGWGCSRSFDRVPSTLCKMLMLRSHGVEWRCSRSFDHFPSTLRKMLMLRVTWGGAGRS